MVLYRNKTLDKFNNPTWVCKCNCKKKTIVSGPNLRTGKTKSCGCLRQRRSVSRNNDMHPSWSGIGEISGTVYNFIRISARRRKIVFNINKKFLWKLFLKQNKKCALTGMDLTFETRSGKCDGTASLDRIDSTKGYVNENVQWTHKDINMMKQSHDSTYFIKLCQQVVNHTNYVRSSQKI